MTARRAIAIVLSAPGSVTLARKLSLTCRLNSEDVRSEIGPASSAFDILDFQGPLRLRDGSSESFRAYTSLDFDARVSCPDVVLEPGNVVTLDLTTDHPVPLALGQRLELMRGGRIGGGCVVTAIDALE